jgi:hypothetical protein
VLNRRVLIAIAILGPVLAPGILHAQNQAIVGLQTVTTYSADARITAVDANARTATVTYPASGPVRTYSVPSQAGRDQLSRVTVGDSLTAINSQVVVVSITPRA